MSTYRVGIVGTGGIAHHHAEYYAAHPSTEIVAGCDINPEALGGFCDKWRVAARYEDYRDLLAVEKPDIVSVCTWTGTHAEIAVAAAESGARAILCEKPIAVDLAGADAILAAGERNGAKVAIHHQTRCSPPFAAARRAVADGAIGEPVLAYCRVQGGLLNIGSHTIDVALYVLGEPDARWVLGQVQRTTNRHERGVPAEDLCSAIVGLEGGVRIVLECDLPDTTQKVFRTVVGSEGMIQLDGSEAVLTGKDGRQALPNEPQPGYLEEFVSWLEGGPEHRCSGHRCRAAHEIMMALYESARSRALVPLPLEKGPSALLEMIEDGTLDVPDQPRYDIRSEAALRYCFPDD